MRIPKIKPYWIWHARPAGGLMLGLRYVFPVSVIEAGVSWRCHVIGVGLVFATLHISLLIPHNKSERFTGQ